MPLKIAISGSTGMIGTALVDFLKSQGHGITRIVRQYPPGHSQDSLIAWDTGKRKIDSSGLEGHDVVIHLAGVSIAGRRWTKFYKEAIYSSRIEGTQLLCEALTRLKQPPRLLLCASAIGYYGNHEPEVVVDESAEAGRDFLAKVCEDWEKATVSASSRNMRVACLRMGPVLSLKGGVLARMLPIFKLGLGGILGTGRQMFSWIALDEIPYIISHLISSAKISGSVNCVSPNPVSNSEFTKTLGEVIRRPTFFPLPGVIVKIMFGEMGDSLLLGGARVVPKRLLESGYQFRYFNLEAILKHLIGV